MVASSLTEVKNSNIQLVKVFGIVQKTINIVPRLVVIGADDELLVFDLQRGPAVGDDILLKKGNQIQEYLNGFFVVQTGDGLVAQKFGVDSDFVATFACFRKLQKGISFVVDVEVILANLQVQVGVVDDSAGQGGEVAGF